MRTFVSMLFAVAVCLAGSMLAEAGGGVELGKPGITPERIFQDTIDWDQVVGTWEVLPDDSPLSRRPTNQSGVVRRTLMTLRKDGSCRVFNEHHPAGSDGMWIFRDHEMFITFSDAPAIKYFVFGVKNDFMVTGSPDKGAGYQLWSRVK